MEDNNEDQRRVKLISSDGHEIFVTRKCAMVSGTIKAMLTGKFAENKGEIKFQDINARILEKVVQYMMYKLRYTNSNVRIPEFPIEPEIALELLMAANYLDFTSKPSVKWTSEAVHCTVVRQAEIASNLPFQALLYYHVYFQLMFYPLTLLLLLQSQKYTVYDSVLQQVGGPLCLAVSFLVECFRLWFGYSGNLLERVPQLTGFLFVTLCPQLPIAIFLAYRGPFSQVTGAISIVFLVLELYFGYKALQELIKRQTASFFRTCQQTEANKY